MQRRHHGLATTYGCLCTGGRDLKPLDLIHEGSCIPDLVLLGLPPRPRQPTATRPQTGQPARQADSLPVGVLPRPHRRLVGHIPFAVGSLPVVPGSRGFRPGRILGLDTRVKGPRSHLTVRQDVAMDVWATFINVPDHCR